MQYIFYAVAIYAAFIVIYIVSENRRPQTTFAWMFLFVTLPGLGVVIYWLFGRENHEFGRTRSLLRQELPEHLSEVLASVREDHACAMERLASAPRPRARLAALVHSSANSFVSLQNQVEVLQDAAETYPRMIEDMRAARQSIHLQYYSWASDALGEELKTLLTGKVAEGVEVRLLYDPLASILMLRQSYIRAMNRGGVRMHPVSPLWRVHTISYRNHRKLAVIDGKVGFTGGLNIGCEHIDPGPGFEIWRDTHLRVEGDAARALQAVFAVDWTNATDERLLDPGYFPPSPDDGEESRAPGVPVQLCLSGPDSRWRAVRKQYFAMIADARERIWAQSPFFILDDTTAEALKTAALAGVDVRIMISERGTNQFLPYWAANTFMLEVAEAGVKVFLYEPGYLHCKTITVDGEVASIGSANWDIRSFSINYELNALIYDRAVAEELERAFERDLDHCKRFDPKEYRSRSRAVRFRDSVARLGSPLM